MSDFRVQGRLGLDGSGFFSTLGKAQGAALKLGTMLAGAFSIGAIMSFSRSVLDLAGNLRQVSEALNINVEWLQKFVNSTATSGGSLQDVEKFLVTSMRNRQIALDSPDSTMGRAFTRLGFSQNDIASLNPQQFMERLIEAFRDGADATAVSALVDIGGKSAKNLIGGFKAGLDEATLVMEEDLLNELEEITAKFTSLGTTLKVAFAPTIKIVADGLLELFNALKIIAAGLQARPEFENRREFLQKRIEDPNANAVQRRRAEKSLRELESQEKREFTKEAIAEEMERQKKEREAYEKTRREAREARRAQQQEPAGLTAAEKTEKEKAAKSASIGSDSRIAVGGFLGQGASMTLGAIAERQLRVQQMTLLVQRDILSAINAMGRLGSFNDLVIPS